MSDRDPAQFCRDLRHQLVGSLTLYCGDRDVAEELAQDVLAKAWQRWETVGVMTSPEAWTHRTAFNLASSWGRRRSAERRANRRVGVDRPVSQPDTATNQAVRDAVASLAPRQRAVIVCRFFLTLSVQETAEVLACAEGTIKATTHQALVVLRASGLIDEPQEVTTP